MALPTLTLTDPHNLAADMSLAMSPRADSSTSFEFDQLSGRPGTASSTGNDAARPDTPSSSRPSPGRLHNKTLSTTTASSHSRSRSRGPSPSRDGSLRQEVRSPIDPLSQQILQRTTGSQQLPNALRPTSSGSSYHPKDDAKTQHAAMAVQPPSTRSDTNTNNNARKELKKGVKAVTFLGRLMGGKKKSSEDHAIEDDDVESSEPRVEGTDAHVFAQSVDNMGFNPRHPQPPAYIKVRSKNKTRRDFDRLFLAQELYCGTTRKLVRTESNRFRRKSSASTDQDTVWAMEFSKDGKYLAAAGADMVVRIWQVLSHPDHRRNNEYLGRDGSIYEGQSPEHLSAPVFHPQPIREWDGHGATILDLSWSKNNFLISSSMDKTVRLWHVSRKECLCTFKHNDFVPSIAFHPKDDRFFLAGSLDSKLRLWSIAEKSVAFTVQTPNMITAVAFTPDGKYAMAGCLDGQCMFYETEGLKYQTQLHIRLGKGANARGSKITAIQSYHSSSGDIKLLITSNDSRVRLYNFRDKSLETKFRGIQNNSSQIRATLNDDGRYVICGSEDRKAVIWSLKGSQNDAQDKTPVEMFEAHDSPTTVACFAPAKTRYLLGKSEDPVYDLCNPPPVTLMSQRERAESHASSTRPATENGSFLRTSLEGRGSLDRPRESSIHAARLMHKAGNIIVTADYTGTIKIFRQDCAWQRRKGEEWDRSSIFGKRGGTSSRAGSIAGASIATKASQRSLRDGRTSAASQVAPQDRILSWRQGIASTPNINGQTAHQSSENQSKDTSRSISPDKSPSKTSNTQTTKTDELSPTSTAPTSLEVSDSQALTSRQSKDADPEPFDDDLAHRRQEGDGMVLDAAGRSDFFWDAARLKAPLERQQRLKAEDAAAAAANGRRPSRSSLVSQLTAEHKSDLSDEEEDGEQVFDDAEEEGPEKRMTCRRCGSTGFSARRGMDGVKLVCESCGLRMPLKADG